MIQNLDGIDVDGIALDYQLAGIGTPCQRPRSEMPGAALMIFGSRRGLDSERDPMHPEIPSDRGKGALTRRGRP